MLIFSNHLGCANFQFLTIAIVLVLSCNSQEFTASNSPGQSASSNTLGKKAELEVQEIGQIMREKVSSEDLTIENLAIAKRDDGGFPSADFSTSTAADYVEYLYCPVGNKASCRKGKTTNSVIELIPFEVGEHFLQIKACAEASKATDGKIVCGEWTNKGYSYTNPNFVDLIDLATRRIEKQADLEKIAAQVIQILQESQKELDKCVVNKAKAEKASFWRVMIGSALELGGTLLTKAFVGGEKTESIIGKKDATPPLKSFAHATDKLGILGSGIDQLKTGLVNAGYYEAKPVPALQAFGNAIFDVFNAKNLAYTGCLAPDKYETTMAAFKIRLQTIQQDVEVLDRQIVAEIAKTKGRP